MPITTYVDRAERYDLLGHATDGVTSDGSSFDEPISDSAGNEGAPRPPRGRESDGKGIIEWDVYENDDGSTSYVYSFKGPVQAEFKLVLLPSSEGTTYGRKLRGLFEDMWRKLVLQGIPVPVLPRSFSGRHERDVRGGPSEDIHHDTEYTWVDKPRPVYGGFPGDWPERSGREFTNRAYEEADT